MLFLTSKICGHAIIKCAPKSSRIGDKSGIRTLPVDLAHVSNDPTLMGWKYAQRMWLEEAFCDLKSFGWQLEEACLDVPQRIAHLLIFLVVAYAWLLLWGHALEARQATARPKKRPDGSTVRRWSLFREGRQAFLLA